MIERTPAGYCAHCRVECRDVPASTIWPRLAPDLAAKVVWVCVECGARVGSHRNGKPLGTAAGPELRNARQHVHRRLDPIWKDAHLHHAYADGAASRTRKSAAIIAKTARKRVYRFLAARMGLAFEDTHVALFDIDECRRAWVSLAGITYDHVRSWAHANPELSSRPARLKVRGDGVLIEGSIIDAEGATTAR